MGANDHDAASEVDKECGSCMLPVSCENSKAAEQPKVVKDAPSVPAIYRQDVVRNKYTSRIGIVTEVAGDYDSDSSMDDDDAEEEEDEASEAVENSDNDDDVGDNNAYGTTNKRKVHDGGKLDAFPSEQIRVTWMDDSEISHRLSDVTLVDRGFLHGDFVAAASDPTGQVGAVVDVNISVDLQACDGSLTKGVSTRVLERVSNFTVGDFVVLGPWLGRVDDVLDNVTVLFDGGCVCKIMKADPSRLKPVDKIIHEDGRFPFYPGQRVKAAASSVFKNAKWLSGSWKANRMEGTITKVTAGSVFIYWIASAGHGPDSSTAPAEEQCPKNLKLLSCFSHANWQLGDWCLLPSSQVTSISLDSGVSKLQLMDSAHLGSDIDSEATLGEPNKDAESMDLDTVVGVDVNNASSDSNPSANSDSCGSSLSTLKEPVHETWPVHRRKVRKVVVRRDKKSRKKEETFERALLIVHTETRVDVAWQDGVVEHGVESVNLIPIDSPGDHEFVSEQYVVEKSSDDNDDAYECKRVGVVKCVNARERTAFVRWLKPVIHADDPREFDKEEVVSVYELEAHPDYDYCYGDVVVRLSPLPVSAETTFPGDSSGESKQASDLTVLSLDHKRQHNLKKQEFKKDDALGSGVETFMEYSDLSWVGNITGLNNGDIEVTWADGMVSTVGPQAVYVVGRDDDQSIGAGSEVSGASWETVNDDEVDALENTVEVATNSISEAEQGAEANPESNGPLSLPLAALGYVTKLATNFFLGGRKHTDQVAAESGSECEVESQGVGMIVESSDSSDEASSEKSKFFNNADSHANHGAVDHVDFVESSRSDVVEEGLDTSVCYCDDASDSKRFDTVTNPLDHYFVGATRQNNNGRKWLKKVQQDWSILQNNLPDGIYVRVYEDRMDVLRAVIVGAYGTPYQDGLFFFDFHLPPEYPNVPPLAYYHSGGWRINPNLYEEGKVCLSLLNTWSGRGNEVWDPSSSSILQVLVSLQGLVLNAKPYFNEAGFERQVGTAEGEKNSVSYNENTFLLNCKTMMLVMRRPPKDFEVLVREHFRRRGHYILKACNEYMRGGYLIGTLTRDAGVSEMSKADANSLGFKLMLAKIVPRMYSALEESGADCREFEHLLHLEG